MVSKCLRRGLNQVLVWIKVSTYLKHKLKIHTKSTNLLANFEKKSPVVEGDKLNCNDRSISISTKRSMNINN